MPLRSAGILAYRGTGGHLEVLLVHPGGPYFRNKDAGAWTIPKGEIAAGEDAQATALREFQEELGVTLTKKLVPLGEIKQRGGKYVEAFAVKTDIDIDKIKSNTFEMEWPPRSGRMRSFPEIDRAQWFSLSVAREKINAAQIPFLERLGS